jgi:hypothetical protein
LPPVSGAAFSYKAAGRAQLSGSSYRVEALFVGVLMASLFQAQPPGLSMRLVLKNGEVLEGVPTATSGSFDPPFGGVSVDPTPHDAPDNQPLTRTVTVGGRVIMAPEVAAFTMTPAMPG